MINVLKYEDKNKENLLNKLLADNNLTEADIIYNITEESGKLFKSKKYSINAILKLEIKKFIKEYLINVGNLMNIDIKCEINETDNIYNVIMVSNNNPILIGKDGRTINSLQLLLRQSLSIQTGQNIKVNLDASNYKANKIKNFEYEIKKILKDVQKTKVEVKLDSMNSFQRRIVHNLVSEYENVTSISEGIEPNRYVIIKYED